MSHSSSKDSTGALLSNQRFHCANVSSVVHGDERHNQRIGRVTEEHDVIRHNEFEIYATWLTTNQG